MHIVSYDESDQKVSCVTWGNTSGVEPGDGHQMRLYYAISSDTKVRLTAISNSKLFDSPA